MNTSDCSYDIISNISVSIVLGLMAVGFAVVGVTILPIIGLVPAAIAAAGAVWFAAAPKRPVCDIS